MTGRCGDILGVRTLGVVLPLWFSSTGCPRKVIAPIVGCGIPMCCSLFSNVSPPKIQVASSNLGILTWRIVTVAPSTAS